MKTEYIENKAEEVLSEFNFKSIPIPVEELARCLNIKIGSAPSEDFSGLLVREENYSFIGVNSNESPVRQRFTIAHELGHYFLQPRKEAFVDYRNHKNHKVKTLPEKEADCFAAALLMPRKTILKDLKNFSKVLSIEETTRILASRYNVSDEAMSIRIRNLSSQIII